MAKYFGHLYKRYPTEGTYGYFGFTLHIFYKDKLKIAYWVMGEISFNKKKHKEMQRYLLWLFLREFMGNGTL